MRPGFKKFEFYGSIENPRGPVKQLLLCQVSVLVPRFFDCCPGLLRSTGFQVLYLPPETQMSPEYLSHYVG